MKKIPLGIFLYVENGLAKIDFTCPDCRKSHENVLVGKPFKCECGCDIYTVPYKNSEDN